ncbi:hypothetical protein LE181_24460 [Streptomyces sp. SCA3-4]|uniref:hypothetical protein n=1 Tax=Streptomyces sichuanensis TaxID=2871810 RepID=UPI001CE3A39B|nr:hypothetical protein [Streptomyces sichuanensis]MCA6095305.1 hypothetical protein [Streptomyces sichuanensis]
MSTLMRAPRECGSWFWDLDEVAEPGLESALAVAARMAAVLNRHGLLTPHRLEYDWYVLDVGGVGIRSNIALTVPLDDPSLPDRVLKSRPSGFPEADVDDIHILGAGTWIDAEGNAHREPGLVDLSVSPAPIGLSAELAVHHDVWAWFDFSGTPHPDVYGRNAPRLTAALQEISSMLGVTPEPGEATYFGYASGLGIGTPEANPDGSGPDVTDSL